MPAVPCKPAGGSSALMIPSAPALLRHRCSQCGGPHRQEASPSRWPRLFVLALKPTGTGSVESDYSACFVSTLIVPTSFKCQLLHPSQLKGLFDLSNRPPCLRRRCPRRWSRCSRQTGTAAGTRNAAAWPVWSKTTPRGPTSSECLTSRSVRRPAAAVDEQPVRLTLITFDLFPTGEQDDV